MPSRSGTPSTSSSRQSTPSRCKGNKCIVDALACPCFLKLATIVTLVFFLVAISFQLPQEHMASIPGYEPRFESSMRVVTYILCAIGVVVVAASLWVQKVGGKRCKVQ